MEICTIILIMNEMYLFIRSVFPSKRKQYFARCFFVIINITYRYKFQIVFWDTFQV